MCEVLVSALTLRALTRPCRQAGPARSYRPRKKLLRTCAKRVQRLLLNILAFVRILPRRLQCFETERTTFLSYALPPLDCVCTTTFLTQMHLHIPNLSRHWVDHEQWEAGSYSVFKSTVATGVEDRGGILDRQKCFAVRSAGSERGAHHTPIDSIRLATVPHTIIYTSVSWHTVSESSR